MSERPEKESASTHSGIPASPADKMAGSETSILSESKDPVKAGNDRWLTVALCSFLALIVWAVFGQTLHHGFVNYDDDTYVYENPEVIRGLTLPGIARAFTHFSAYNWHPLTWLSHMLDCQLYGLNAGGHHLTSVLLHAATAMLLFLLLRRITAFPWRSAFVAAVFAIHPLRVESVAWVAERKDVLSGLFLMLTLLAYASYVSHRRRQALGFYLLSLFFFALGLMSKPMLVTLPFVLLLLDYWPIQRFNRSTIPRLLFEKLPFFARSAASCVVTLFAQAAGIQPFDSIPLPLRVGNAAISYVAYLGQMFWPSELAVLYPLTGKGVGVTTVGLSLALLAGITAGGWVLRRRCPWLLTGWLWYVVMLVPVIGIVQVGGQARADRYTYLPQIGLYLLLTWGMAELSAGWRQRRVLLCGSAAVILAALIYGARAQSAYWQDSETLWTHTLACTADNFVAHNDLGNVLLQKGRVDEAAAQYRMALQINPNCVESCYNLGNALVQKGQADEAIAWCQRALEIKPDSLEAHGNLGNALFQKGRLDDAITQYQEVLQILPGSAKACCNLGNALLQKGCLDAAIAAYRRALGMDPGYADARNNLNYALALRQRAETMLAQCKSALQIRPDAVDALNNLAWLLATSPDAHVRDGVQAVQYAERARALTHDKVTLVIGTLAAAYAEAGRFDDAVATAEKACALAQAKGEPDLLQKNRELLALYRARQPYRELAEK